MAIIRELRGKTPQIGKDCFLAETAALIGDVLIGDHSSIWYSVVLRGDVNFIHIGKKVNIQDGVVIHGTYKKNSTIIGDNVTIGHNATIHGCQIENNVLVGMGAVVLDGAILKQNSIVAAGAVVLPGTIVSEGCIFGGVPAKKIKEMNEEERKYPERNAENYMIYKSWYVE
jgi:carbonic anhydrase/acetyltransferase-like protein (isoleucine patch superfamily)